MIDELKAVFFDFAGTLLSDRDLRDVHLQQLRRVADLVDADVDDSALRAAYRHGIGVAYRGIAGRSWYIESAVPRPDCLATRCSRLMPNRQQQTYTRISSSRSSQTS